VKKKLKVCYVISVLKNSTGKGGHFHSLKTLVDELSHDIDVDIVVVGTNPTPIFDFCKPNIMFVETKWNRFAIFDIMKCIKIIKKIDPDVIHAYDTMSLRIVNVARLFCLRKPVFYTKCGGPNPKSKAGISYSPNIIFFSKENMNFYRKINKLKDSNFYLIPNRVKKITTDKDGVEKIRNIIGEGAVLLRIGRFSSFHEKSFKQTVNLFNELSSLKDIPPLKLVLIGAIESKEVYGNIRNSIVDKSKVFLFTENEYTKEASKFIDIADLVVGTGRSLMEAASLGKILLTPQKEERLPVLVDENSFEDCFKTNFSDRNIVKNYIEEENLEKIKKSLKDESFNNNLKQFCINSFNENFDIEKSATKQKDLYFLSKKTREKYSAKIFLHGILEFIRFLK
jgi:glycosyltransferase involved in cell wall biosynthesis